MLVDTMFMVLDAGGSLIVDGSKLLPDSAARLAAAALSGGGTITFRNAKFAPELAVKVARAGNPGHVILDVT